MNTLPFDVQLIIYRNVHAFHLSQLHDEYIEKNRINFHFNDNSIHDCCHEIFTTGTDGGIFIFCLCGIECKDGYWRISNFKRILYNTAENDNWSDDESDN